MDRENIHRKNSAYLQPTAFITMNTTCDYQQEFLDNFISTILAWTHCPNLMKFNEIIQIAAILSALLVTSLGSSSFSSLSQALP